jgi:hypothetical protein
VSVTTFDTAQPPDDLPPRDAGWVVHPDGTIAKDGLAILPGPDQDRKARVADWWARWFVGRTVTGGAQWERRRITQTELDL